jgi:branched-chain amino acid transport system permease protein
LRWRDVPKPARAAGAAAALLATWAVLNAILAHGAPAGVLLSGVVFGAINALVAVAIVLVYRANRVVNFAAAEFGSVAAVVAIELHIQEHVNYFLSVAAGVVLAAVVAGVLEVTVIRRFSNAPRLIVAVVTIGLAQVLNGLSVVIPIEWNGARNAGTFTTPFHLHFRVFPVVFNANHVLAVVIVPIVLAALVWFLRYTHYGVAIRAAADNGDRARLLAVPVTRLSTIIWTTAGVLSALAVLLRVPILGFSSFTSVSSGGLPLLLMTLTAAVIGGMSSLPVTVAAAVGLGIVDQLGAWTFRSSTYVDAALLAVILIVLLVRRDRLTRAADAGIATWQAVRPVRPVPAELAALPSVRVGRRAFGLAVLAFALGLPHLLTPAHTQLAALILIYGIVACSLVVLTGWAGHISLGQVAFMGFGGATTGILITRHGADLFLALAAGALVAAAFAVIIGIPALRIRGPFLAVVTIAFAVTSADYFLVPKYFPWFDPSGTVPRLSLFGRISIDSDRQMYYLCLVALALVLTAVRGLRNSHAGRAMIAGKENRLAAQAFAVDTTRTNLVAFALSGAIAGFAGGLFVIHQQAYNFSSFNAEQGLVFFTMVVIGGLGSLPGAVLGAVYVYGVQYLLPAGWSVFATGAGIVVLLMFLPGGLGELVFRVRDGILRRIAARHGLVVPSLVADTAAPPEEPPGLTVGETPLLGAAAAPAGESVPVLAARGEGAGDARG